MDDGEFPPTIILCVATNVSTRLVVTPLRTETVGEIRATIKDYHKLLFPELGDMDVASVSIKLFGRRCRVADSIRIGAVFHTRLQDMLFVELSRVTTGRSVVDLAGGQVAGPNPNGSNPNELPPPLLEIHDRERATIAPDLQAKPLTLPGQSGRLMPQLLAESISPKEVHLKLEVDQSRGQDHLQEDNTSKDVLVGYTNGNCGDASVERTNGVLLEGCDGDANVLEKKVKKKRRRHDAKDVVNTVSESWKVDKVVTEPAGKESPVEPSTSVTDKMETEPQKVTSTLLEKDSELRRSRDSRHKSRSTDGMKQSTFPGKDIQQDNLDTPQSEAVVESKPPAACNGSSDQEGAHERSHKWASKPRSGGRQPMSKTTSAQKIAQENQADGTGASKVARVDGVHEPKTDFKTPKGDINREYIEREVNHRSRDARSDSTTVESMGHITNSKKRKKGAKSKKPSDNNGTSMNGNEEQDSLAPDLLNSVAMEQSDHEESKKIRLLLCNLAMSLTVEPEDQVKNTREVQLQQAVHSMGNAKSLHRQVSPSEAHLNNPDDWVTQSNRRTGRRSAEKLKYQHLLDSQDGFDELITMSQQRLKADAAHHQDRTKSEDDLPEPLAPISLVDETLSKEFLPDSQPAVVNAIPDSQEAQQRVDVDVNPSKDDDVKEPRLDDKQGPISSEANLLSSAPKEKPKTRKKRQKSVVPTIVNER